MKIKDMKARIKAINRLGTFYSNYKSVSLNEINQMKEAMSNDAAAKTSLTLYDAFEGGKEYTIIPANLMKETVIIIECQEG